VYIDIDNAVGWIESLRVWLPSFRDGTLLMRAGSKNSRALSCDWDS
jgi:hypothetical protein